MSTNPTGLTLVFGAAAISPKGAFKDVDSVTKLLDTVEAAGIRNIDTAQIYGGGASEKLLGESGAGQRGFTIDSKAASGFAAAWLEGGSDKKGGDPDFVLEAATNSIKKLQIPQMDVYYLHAPDYETPFATTLKGINEAYKKGFFKRFGLSNFHAEDVQKVYDICKENGYPLPSVYQGNYNAVARKQETVLFPTLRKLGISFYAYSPIAGGFLTKTRQQIEEKSAGRFQAGTQGGDLYLGLYDRPSLVNALDEWASVAKAEGVSQAELAYRWVAWNSPLNDKYGDKLIAGASKLEQIPQVAEWLKNGKLSDEAARRIDEIWKSIEHEAPLDNLHK